MANPAYIAASRLCHVQPTERPRPGELLRQLRELRNFKTPRSASLSFGLSHAHMGNLEKAPGKLNLQADTVERIARGLKVSVDLIHKIASGTLDELPADLDIRSSSQTLSPPDSSKRVHAIRFLGSVSAGLTGDGVAMPIDWLTVSDRFLGGHHPDDLYALEVTGDSMVSEDARWTIPPGSIVLVHENLVPRPGNVVVAWLDDEDLGVLKVYKPADGMVWLLSRNPDHPAIPVSEETPASIRGVMIGHWTPAQGVR